MDGMELGRISIAPPLPDDDAGMAYQQVADARMKKSVADWLNEADEVAPPVNADLERAPGAQQEQPAAVGESAETPEAGAIEEPEQTGWVAPTGETGIAAGLLDWAGAIGGDVLQGAKEAPRQVVGGVIDALGEVDQFMQQVLPIGGAALFNEAGEFDPSFVDAAQMEADRASEETIFDMISPDDANSVTGSFVRATAQFLTGFVPGVSAVRGLQVAKGSAILTGMAAGAIADMVVFDPNEDRLSTFLNQIPSLSGIVPDYLANNDPDQSHWEGRLKNAIEGLGLGAATDGLMSAFRYYKAARKAKAQSKAEADPVGATVQAAKDQARREATAELANEIPDEALRPLGDPEGSLLIEARPGETAQAATERLEAARVRSAKADTDRAFLDRVDEIRERMAGATKAPAKGTTRYYYGSSDAAHDVRGQDELWVSPDPEYAKNYRRGENENALWYVDIPGDQRGALGVRDETNGYNIIGKLPKEWAGKAKRLKVADNAGRDPLDDLLDELRSGAVTTAKLPKRPVAEILKAAGGIDPASSLAGDLRSRGITAKSFPGLFKRGGRQALDNLPMQEHPLMLGRGQDAGGYVEQQAWIDGLEAELKGEPYRTPEQQQQFDDLISPVEDLEVELDRMGIDYRQMSNDRVKERIKEIQDEDALFRRDITEGPATARTAEDLEKEIAEEAAARGVPVEQVRAEKQPKVYINHARIAAADDVRAIIQELADADEAAIVDKSRGVVTNAQTIKESDKEFRDLNDLLGRDPGPMSAAQATAARRLLASSGEQIVQLAKIAKDPNATPADLYNFRRAVQVHYALQSEVLAARTETARALQAWSIPVGSSKARGAAINDLITAQGGAGNIQELARALDAASSNPAAVNDMIRDAGKGRVGAALYQVWINGILASPTTHMVNITSNAMTALWAIPERYLAAGISKAFYDGDVAAGEAAAQAFGLVKGIRDGFRLIAADMAATMGREIDALPWDRVRNSVVAQNMKGALTSYADARMGQDGPLNDLFDAFVQVEGTQHNAISATALGMKGDGGFAYGVDMLGKIINLPGAALNNEDKLFKSIGYRMELQALAYRQAMSEGLEGQEFAERVVQVLRNPPDNLKAEAIEFAHVQTFTNNLGEKGQAFQNFVRKVPGLKVVAPFIRTPTNIMKFTFARTPLAYLASKTQADIRAGGARAAQAHARIALGTMFMLAIVDMQSEGFITGAGPLGNDMGKTQGVRSTRRGVGGPPPYSIKIGDRWYSYNRLDPIGMMIGMGTDIGEILASADEADSELLVAAGVLALSQNLASKRYMQGAFDFMAAIDPSNVTSDPGKYITNFAGSITPYSSFLRNHTRSMDPTLRDPREQVFPEGPGRENPKPDQVASFFETLKNNIKKGIPGMSDELPPMRDLFGEPISSASGLGWGWDYVSPIASRADNDDPVTRAIVDNRVNLSFPAREIEGVKLTPAEYDEFSEAAGKMAKEQLERLIASPSFSRMSDGPDGMKAELIKDVVNQSREYARGVVLRNNPELRERAIGQKLLRQRSLTGN